jgi:catechol 2,3-dioxygenase-like lactoylglutathione lyase family enzyme
VTTTLKTVTYLVRDYEEAIAWFNTVLHFKLVENTDLGNGKRWVILDAGGVKFLLAKVNSAAQSAAVGNAAGGRVAYFLYTHDFTRDHARMLAAGVKFKELPRHETYGTVAVFEDLYGNGWDLIEPKP